MSLIDIVKHARPMKLKDGKRHVWPTLASMVYLADGITPITDGNGNWNADKALDAEKLGGKAPEYYLQPRNLLDNSNFANPVNQRGYTTSSNAYIVDRWLTFNDNEIGEALLHKDGIETTGVAYIQQRLPVGSLKQGVPYTIAVYYADGTVDAGTNGYYGSYDDFDIINHIKSNGKRIASVALYEGSYTAETLPPYVPKGYAAELAECQRYYEALNYGVNKTIISDKEVVSTMIQYRKKRVSPTLTDVVENASGLSEMMVFRCRDDMAIVAFTQSTTDINLNKHHYGTLEVSADL